jgi:O-antigen/teichoic acid export membrane protein
MISKATSLGDREATKSTIQHAMRFSLLLLLLVAAPISGAAKGVLQLAYPADYVAGAPALSILVLGVAAFALFAVAATAISGAGQPSLAAGIAAVALATVVAANRVLILDADLGSATLPAAATGTTIGMVVALVGSAVTIYALFGVFIPALTWLRGAAAAVVGYATAFWFPSSSPPLALGALAVGFSAALVVLLATGEVSAKDWLAFKRIVRRD